MDISLTLALASLFLFSQANGQSCTAGLLPPPASTAASYKNGWLINHKDPSSCSGKLTSYELEYYTDAVSNNDLVYLSLWIPLAEENSYELVENSTRMYTYGNQNSNNDVENVTVVFGEDSVAYAPGGAVVGAYIPNNKNLPIVGYQSFSSYELCSSKDTDGSESVLTCSTSDFGLSSLRLHLIANIEIINCGNSTLVAPDNGYRIGNATYTFASIVEFNCSLGYYLTGPSVLQCTANGNWDNTVPDCLPVSCEPPPIPNNGSIIGYDSNVYYNYSTSIVYQCDEGYILNGSSVSTCQADKEWSDSVPECIELCEDFEFPNGIKTPSSDTLLIPGTIIQLSCINGYLINGTSSIKCLSNSEWNISVIPQCIGSVTETTSHTSSKASKVASTPHPLSSSSVSHTTPTTGSGSSNSSATYAGIAVAVIMGIIIAIIVAILVLCIVNKRHRATKKYNVNNEYMNPTISNGGIAGGGVENEVYFMTATPYEEPVKTIKKDVPDSEYSHLNNATVTDKTPPLDTKAAAHTAQIYTEIADGEDETKETTFTSSQDYNFMDNTATNQIYMDPSVNGDLDKDGQAPYEVVNFPQSSTDETCTNGITALSSTVNPAYGMI